MNILIIGGTGYLGKNFSALCSELNVLYSISDIRQLKNTSVKEFDVVIDFSMINRSTLPWAKDTIDMFKKNHNSLLDKIIEFKNKYIRVSSIFDVRSFIRNDSYTMLSRQISANVLYRISNSTVIYSHAVFGGLNSNSFIDSGIAKNSTFQESIRDYIYIKDLGEEILTFASMNKQLDSEFEFGTGKPYLTSDIKNAKDSGIFNQLVPVNINSAIFCTLSKRNLVCSAIQPKMHNISSVLLRNSLVQHLSKT